MLYNSSQVQQLVNLMTDLNTQLPKPSEMPKTSRPGQPLIDLVGDYDGDFYLIFNDRFKVEFTVDDQTKTQQRVNFYTLSIFFADNPRQLSTYNEGNKQELINFLINSLSCPAIS